MQYHHFHSCSQSHYSISRGTCRIEKNFLSILLQCCLDRDFHGGLSLEVDKGSLPIHVVHRKGRQEVILIIRGIRGV